MKKLLFSALLCVLSTAFIQAQGAFVRLNAGYGISGSNDVLGLSTVQDSTFTTISQKNIYGTTGGGLSANIGGGYMVTKHFGVTLDFYYLLGTKRTTNRSETIINSIVESEYTRQFRAALGIVVQGGGELINPYARVGILTPLAGFTYRETISEGLASGDVFNNLIRAEGSPSLGFQSSIGVDVKAIGNLHIFGEVFYAALRIKSSKAEVIKNNKVDAAGEVTDFLDGAAFYSTNINFVDELTASSNDFTNPDFDTEKPLDILATKTNYNSVGITVGVRYNFGGNE